MSFRDSYIFPPSGGGAALDLLSAVPDFVFDPNSTLVSGGVSNSVLGPGIMQGARDGVTRGYLLGLDETVPFWVLNSRHIHNGAPPNGIVIGLGVGFALAGTGAGGAPASMAEIDHYLLMTGRGNGTDSTFAGVAWHNDNDSGFEQDPAATTGRHKVKGSCTFYEYVSSTGKQAIRDIATGTYDASTEGGTRFGLEEETQGQTDLYGGTGMVRVALVSMWRNAVTASNSTVDLTTAQLIALAG